VGSLGIEPSQVIYKITSVKPSGPLPLAVAILQGIEPHCNCGSRVTVPLVDNLGVEPSNYHFIRMASSPVESLSLLGLVRLG
jgi:hypothetical protein